MLSLQQAIEIKESIVSYLKATFTFRKKEVAQAFDEFIYDSANGMFKGPYISLKLRFVKAKHEEVSSIPLEIKPEWLPYDHQVKAWHKLSTRGQKPAPTIVTTGTGSGKTEAFLYPILDYCYRQHHRPGIKVIIMYPMNALATDQAKRLAEAIFEDERLSDKVRAGLFIGEGKDKTNISRNKIMGPDHIIEDRDTITDSPPDILLTNFKMLDYALMKHNYHNLWTHNLTDRELFKYLVLDELHTYDGAQGTDVANLIRRLKLKLEMREGQLCPVGTSATIGSGKEAPALLADYASKIFGENIGEDSIITENRIDTDSFFDADDELIDSMPLSNRLKHLVYHESDDFDAYLKSHIKAWQQDANNPGIGLKQLKIVKDLITLFSRERNMLTMEQVMLGLSLANENYRKLPERDATNYYNPRERVLESLLTLIAYAKDPEDSRLPFIYSQVQLWIRELSGVQYTMEEKPRFSFRDNVDAREEISALPPWYCRECNSSGWLGVKGDDKDFFIRDINEVYEKYFSHHKNLYFLLPKDELNAQDLKTTGYNPDDFLQTKLDPITLQIVEKEAEGIEIQAFRKLNNNKSEHICPCCNTENTVNIVGTKIPTLSSIAVSQTLATDLDSTEDKNRKVLAFTNSVQDAAHQAGFVESRNYRFTLRASIQKVINRMFVPVRLSELSNEFISYWKEHADTTGDDPVSGYLYRFFPKDYLGKASPEDYRRRNGSYQDYFLKEFDLRVQWEIYSEFGFNSHIGRTLEKTGASSVFFDEEALNKSWIYITDWIAKNDISKTIDKETYLRFTNLILHRSRNRGAIDHVFLSKYRNSDLSLWDLNWMKDTRHILNPKYHPRVRLPKLLGNRSSKQGLLDTTQTQGTNWFHSYFRKSFLMAAVTTEFINEFYDQWIYSLVKSDILIPANSGELINYTISPDMIWVKKDVKLFNCNTCEDIIYTQDNDILSENASCLSYRCTGIYQKSEPEENNYYKAVYNRNRFPRIYAAEHTGLLVREVREELETDFKKREKFNSVNTLVATSTLEMGIDIGDLNTAYNNSTPPLPSNFLQRVGRAGRKSGSSVIINFAKNQNHDLYYFADPLEMMEGEVNTPGCYLEASDILKRHFTAFCLDSWTSADPTKNTIPNFIRDLKLNQEDIVKNENFFINRVVNFIQSHRDRLTSGFITQYSPLVKERAFKTIEESLDSGFFYDHLFDVFLKIKNEFKKIENRLQGLKEEMELLNLAENDPLRDEYQKENRSLKGIRRSINERNLLEHLTNVGILPNYAFPETGVQLNAHVFRYTGEVSTTSNLDEDYELIRSASQAIKELAPENFFYTQGYRFEISGLNTFDWGDEKNFHIKRFCSKCDHLALSSLTTTNTCPKCGDESWGSASNIHRFVKLTAVRSFNTSSRAVLSDQDDDRDTQHYQMMNHVSFREDSSDGAWVLKDIPFGIEFVRNATITTVNYGRHDSNDARRLRINDAEVMTKGFVTCKHCGMSISATHLKKTAAEFHYGYCKHKNIKYDPELTKDIFEELYLFREIETELLKIILPVQEFNTEADIRMFQAGLELGLKKYFKGNPGHIRVMDYKEFNQNTNRFDRFLLLYDTIPGGSGYLEELFDNKNFNELLRNSYESIRDCNCQQYGHDGCYKCIYSYGNQYKREGLSRKKAETWFGRIYTQAEGWVKNDLGLTSITNSGRIEESELEDRFVKLLSLWCDKNEGFHFYEEKNHGKIDYKLTINSNDVDAAYKIRPQIILGPKDGIEFSTRTDFMIICTKFKFKEKEYKSEISRIALYLDGFQYHASSEHNVFERDVAIRKAITANSWYKVWTLTWEDLDYFEKALNDTSSGDRQEQMDEVAMIFSNNFMKTYNRIFPELTKGTPGINLAKDHSNLLRLLERLIHPFIQPFMRSHFTYLASWTTKVLSPSFNPNDIHKLIDGSLNQDDYIKTNKIKNFDGLIPVEGQNNFNFADWKIWVNLGREEVLHSLSLGDTSIIDKKEWQYFWTIFNIFQSSNFISLKEKEIGDKIGKTEEKLIDELLPLFDEPLHDIIRKAIAKGIISEANYEHLDSLLNEHGEVQADAELVLEKVKIAISPFSDESKNIFTQLGYKIFKSDELDKIEL